MSDAEAPAALTRPPLRSGNLARDRLRRGIQKMKERNTNESIKGKRITSAPHRSPFPAPTGAAPLDCHADRLHLAPLCQHICCCRHVR